LMFLFSRNKTIVKRLVANRMLAGAKTAEFGASFLEESEIFVRSSEDDDD
uniref:Uncharacterized protein n=1 Tax=Meloidogyne javanica TaxID=6303 RepID=A0A915M0Q3_MELJA